MELFVWRRLLMLSDVEERFYSKQVLDNIYFKVNSPYRSGSEYTERLIGHNFKDIVYYDSPTSFPGWRHYLPIGKLTYRNIVIARSPLKWINSLIKSDKGLFRKYNVTVQERNSLTFEKHSYTVSVPKLLDRWHDYYNVWLNEPNIEFIWYHDVLREPQRILDYVESKWNLKRRDRYIESGTYYIPDHTPSSEKWSEERQEKELNLDYLPLLSDNIISYVRENVDTVLIERMNSLRGNYGVNHPIEW